MEQPHLPPTTLLLDGASLEVIKLGVGYYTRAFTKKFVEDNKVTWSDLTIAAKGSQNPTFFHVCYSVLLTEQVPLTDAVLQQIEQNSQVDATDIAGCPDNNKTTVHYKGTTMQVPWKPESFKPASKKIKRKAASGARPLAKKAKTDQGDQRFFLQSDVLKQFLSREQTTFSLTKGSSANSSVVFPLQRGANFWRTSGTLASAMGGGGGAALGLSTALAVPEPVTAAVPEPVTAAVPEPVTAAVPEPVTAAVPEPATETANGAAPLVSAAGSKKKKKTAKVPSGRLESLSVDSGGAQPPITCVHAVAAHVTGAPAVVHAAELALAAVPSPQAVTGQAHVISPERALLLMLLDMASLPAHVRVLVAHVLQ
jgi:hypothetical protein